MRPTALVLLAAVLLAGLGHLTSRPPDEPAAATAHPPPPVVFGGALTPTNSARADEGDAAFTARTSVGARDAAQRFVAAYTRWETGDDGDETRRALSTSASPQLTALLASGRGQPDPPTGVSRARLTSLVAGSVGPDRAATVAASLLRDGQTTGLAMLVKREGGRWRVTSIGR